MVMLFHGTVDDEPRAGRPLNARVSRGGAGMASLARCGADVSASGVRYQRASCAATAPRAQNGCDRGAVRDPASGGQRQPRLHRDQPQQGQQPVVLLAGPVIEAGGARRARFPCTRRSVRSAGTSPDHPLRGGSAHLRLPLVTVSVRNPADRPRAPVAQAAHRRTGGGTRSEAPPRGARTGCRTAD